MDMSIAKPRFCGAFCGRLPERLSIARVCCGIAFWGSVANFLVAGAVAKASDQCRRVAMFKSRQFDQSMILLCVRWHLAYNLSLRDRER